MTSHPLIKDVSLFLDDKPSVYALRQQAKDAFLLQGIPNNHNEAWKYTDLKILAQKNFKIDESDHICGHNCCESHDGDSIFIDVKFCHGKLHIEEFNVPEGLVITPLPIALYENMYKQYIFHSFDIEKHPFAALNGIYLEQGICIHLEENIKISQPVIIRYNQNHCDGLQMHFHNLVILEKNSSLDFIEIFKSDDNSSYLTNIVNEIYLKSNASLCHYKKQEETSSAYHISLNAVKVQQNAFYKQFYVANGAKISRHETCIDLLQPSATAEVYSAYVAKSSCLTDITTNINHTSTHTHSTQLAKAVLEENSAAAFQGKIHIAPNAFKTEGHQLHKALYLSDDAELNCKPELEIFADDVKCSHGASCGELDKDQLFYLTSRGIDIIEAKNMLISAHLEEIFSKIENEEIRKNFILKF